MAQESNNKERENLERNERTEITSLNPRPKRSRRWLLLLLGVLFIVLVVIFLLFLSGAGNQQTTSQTSTETIAGTGNSTSQPIFTDGMEFQINLADGRRFLMLTLRLALIDADTNTYLTPRLPILRDIVIGTLQRKTSEDLRSPAGLDQLKKDLLRRLNSGKIFSEEMLQKKKTTQPIQDVYFEKFILQ